VKNDVRFKIYNLRIWEARNLKLTAYVLNMTIKFSQKINRTNLTITKCTNVFSVIAKNYVLIILWQSPTILLEI